MCLILLEDRNGFQVANSLSVVNNGGPDSSFGCDLLGVYD